MSKPKSPKAPTAQPPPAVPVESPEPAEYTMRRAAHRFGFRKSILTGNLAPVSTLKKTTLGG